MTNIGPEHTHWVPAQTGGIDRVYHGDPSWRTIAYWPSDLHDLQTEYGREWLCRQLGEAFEMGREAQSEITRRAIFHGKPQP